MSRQTQGSPNKPNCALICREVGPRVQLCNRPSHIDQLLLYHRDAADHGQYGTGPQPDSRRHPLPRQSVGNAVRRTWTGAHGVHRRGPAPASASCVELAVLPGGNSRGLGPIARREPTTRTDLWRVSNRRAEPTTMRALRYPSTKESMVTKQQRPLGVDVGAGRRSLPTVPPDLPRAASCDRRRSARCVS